MLQLLQNFFAVTVVCNNHVVNFAGYRIFIAKSKIVKAVLINKRKLDEFFNFAF